MTQEPEARSMLRFSCFVTGTDTEIGKTLVSSALLHALAQRGLRSAGMKPVAAGASWRDGAWHNEDVDMLAAASSVKLPIALISPYLMREPAAPHIVALHEQVNISAAHILECYGQLAQQAEAVVVEGVGGFCVPLNDELDTADLAQQLALPVILVVGMRLGCLSHALLTVQAIAARGLRLAGWVANTVDADMRYAEENLQALSRRIAAPLLGHIPRLPEPTCAAAAPYLNLNLLM
ncbi:dethiobiotin synthase [Undibacterium sp.]|jgi:dethiobiotin synthetase|uniref:dethiobiotin synthase n=1 Tax=Undibacterium sp. TaxID=1914977 RepID=UPI002BEE1616|nr:dethiobiotin synthase [Undibacterium sp.]HTD04381.1 dethiobiotin synthase [Undibacterium sp.]